MNIKEAEIFCQNWLPLWTGGNPAALIEFYSDDAIYLDPTVKEGLKGKGSILKYFEKLLQNNPEWQWTSEEIIPTEKGFTLKWKALIPVGKKTIIEYGLDIVEITNEKITRNEVYFDTLNLITAIKSLTRQGT